MRWPLRVIGPFFLSSSRGWGRSFPPAVRHTVQVMSIKNPSNVIAGFEDAVGGTFFHLNDLQVVEPSLVWSSRVYLEVVLLSVVGRDVLAHFFDRPDPTEPDRNPRTLYDPDAFIPPLSLSYLPLSLNKSSRPSLSSPKEQSPNSPATVSICNSFICHYV